MAMAVAREWFAQEAIADGLTRIWEPHAHELIQSNIWHLGCKDSVLLVDSGMGIQSLRTALPELFKRPVTAVATHTHHDHYGGFYDFGDDLAVHELEADGLRHASHQVHLVLSAYPKSKVQGWIDAGYPITSDQLIDHYPYEGFDPHSFSAKPVAPTRLLKEGDVIDMGDRAFEVLHLPGHSPGGIGLWEARSGWLFVGDTVYDGPLLDQIDGASIDDYVQTMERLLRLPVTLALPGHEGALDGATFKAIVENYLRLRA